MESTRDQKGMMIILSSPSGAGKSTIARMLLKGDSNLVMSISATTRSKRASETDGIDYHFVSQAEFDQMFSNNQLLEYAQIYENYYGTPKQLVSEQLHKGKDVLFDIDWQGAKQIYQNCHKQDIVSIFLLPPSMQSLHDRLKKRAEDSPETITKRFANAEKEILHYHDYDYVLINDNLDVTFKTITDIIRVERLKTYRQITLPATVNELLKYKSDAI